MSTPIVGGAKRRKQSYNHSVYNTKRWKALRLQALDIMPICVCCTLYGITKSSEDVDHIIPIAMDHAGAYRLGNLQSLCKSCHSRKTTYETKEVIYNYLKRTIIDLRTGSVSSM